MATVTQNVISKLSLINHSNEITTLKDVKVPDKFFRRAKMDVHVLDELFGGTDWPGILPGSSILLTGHPGAGKSTAALQFADLLQRNAGRNVLYNVGEENDIMVAMRANRLGLTGNFGLSKIEDVDDLIKACRDSGVEVLFQDSIQTLRTKEELSPQATLKAVAKKLHKFAKDDDVTVFMIGHITKGGDFAGPMQVKHDCDVHSHIRLNVDTSAREFTLTKNRFGPAGIPYECNMSSKGLDFNALAMVEPKAEGEKVAGGKAGERRDAIRKLIKDELLGGKKISAYCLSKFKDPFTGVMGVDCSGGFWRSMLERVVNELRAENHIIGETILDNRKHFFLEV